MTETRQAVNPLPTPTMPSSGLLTTLIEELADTPPEQSPAQDVNQFDEMTLSQARCYFQDSRVNPTTLPRSVVYNPRMTLVESERVMLNALQRRGVQIIHTAEELPVSRPPYAFRRLRHEMVRLIELAAFEGETPEPNGLEQRAGHWLRASSPTIPEDIFDETPAKPKAPEFNKAVFLNNIRASEELRAIVADMTEKGDILKAVFEYNNRPRKLPKVRINKRVLAKMTELNEQVQKAYLEALELFHEKTMDAFNRGNVGTFLSDWGEIKRGKTLDTSVLTHPLFKVVGFGQARRATFGRVRNLGHRIRVTTREDVYFNFNGMRINFGKYTFSLYLDSGRVTFHPAKENFRYNAGPYLSGNNVCMGSNSFSIQSKIREWKLGEALTELYTTMTHFNPESGPFRGIDSFFNDALNNILRRRNGTLGVIEYVTAKKPEQKESEEVNF